MFCLVFYIPVLSKHSWLFFFFLLCTYVASKMAWRRIFVSLSLFSKIFPPRAGERQHIFAPFQPSGNRWIEGERSTGCGRGARIILFCTFTTGGVCTMWSWWTIHRLRDDLFWVVGLSSSVVFAVVVPGNWKTRHKKNKKSKQAYKCIVACLVDFYLSLGSSLLGGMADSFFEDPRVCVHACAVLFCFPLTHPRTQLRVSITLTVFVWTSTFFISVCPFVCFCLWGVRSGTPFPPVFDYLSRLFAFSHYF